MGIWVDLPDDLLERIYENLSHVDLLNIGAVCKSWRSTYLRLCCRLPKNVPLSLCQPRLQGVPLLLLSGMEGSVSREYAALTDHDNVCGELFLPELANKWICGSSWGWLILTDIRGEEVCLLNPITKCQIKLPSQSTFTKRTTPEGMPDDAEINSFHYVYKAIISDDPSAAASPQDCIVMAIVGNMRQLSFCKIGDDKWTNVEGSPPTLEDVIYSQGNFYAPTQYGVVASFDGKNPNSGMTIVATALDRKYHHTLKYLAVSSGRLLQISQAYESKIDFFEDGSLDDESTETVRFDIFELVKRESPVRLRVFPDDWVHEFQREEEIWHEWVPVEDLSDQVLLLGNSTSLSLPSRIYNCRGNCIHFSDNHFDRHLGQVLGHFKNPKGVCHDIGVFNIAEKSIHKYQSNDPHHYMPSVWFTPNPS